MKTIQVRAYLSPKQKKTFQEQLDCHRLLYNTCLETSINFYKENKKNISSFDLIKSLIPNFRTTDTRFLNCNYSSLQQTIRRFDKTLKSFFRRVKKHETPGFPRFKSYDRFNTIEFTFGDGLTIKKNKVKVQGLGEIKIFWNQEIVSKPKAGTLTKRGDQYYVNFFIETFNGVAPVNPKNSIGFDFGLKTFLTDSNGEKIESPKFHKQDLKEKSKIHKKIHKFEKGSKERERYKKAARKIENRIANRRKNSNHQLSRQLINKYDILCFEDIKLQKLTSEIKNINRTYRDVAFGQLKTFLTYKAENAGKKLVFVNPAYTSQMCSCCSKIIPKELEERIHNCECGYKEDRDVNAAKNILRLGLQSLGLNP